MNETTRGGRFARLDFETSPAAPEQPAAEVWPDLDAPACMAAAAEQFDSGLYEAALVHYSRALRFDRELAAAWLGQVRALICLGEYREAILWSNRGLERFHDCPDLLAAKGLALVLSGDSREGIAFSDGAVETRAPSAWIWLARGESLLAAGQHEANAR